MDRLTSLPPEVFNGITDHLRQADLRALVSCSRSACALAEPALYRSITVNREAAFVAVSHTLAKKPHLRGAVRSYSVGGGAPRRSLGLLDGFVSLREFSFRTDGSVPVAHLARMIEGIASGGWMPPTLKRCSVKIQYAHVRDVPTEVGEKLLCAVLSSPHLEVATLSYAPDVPGEGMFGPLASQMEPRELPDLPRVGYTSLRELDLRWDGIQPPWLSGLLRLPRALEAFHLRVCMEFQPLLQEVSRPMEDVLRPVARTLRSLIIGADFPENDGQRWGLASFGIHWGSDGMREMQKLERLKIPAWTWVDQRRVLGRYLDVPESLTTLVLQEVLLLEVCMPENTFFKLEWPNHLASKQGDILGALERAPRFRYLHVTPSADVEEVLLLSKPLPAVHLGPEFTSLADRGIRILVQGLRPGLVELATTVL